MKTKYKFVGFNPLGFLSENGEPNVKLQFVVKSLTGFLAGYSFMNSQPDNLIHIAVIGFVLDTLCSCLVIEEIKTNK